MDGLLSNKRPSVYGVEQRDPYESELEFFRKNPSVAGMASEDNRIVINPFSKLSEKELDAVRMNEAARVYMRSMSLPRFSLTKEQSETLSGTEYGNAKSSDRKATVIARIISGDPSAGKATDEQRSVAAMVMQMMGIKPKGLLSE